MTAILLITSIVIFSCIAANRLSQKSGLPALLLFMIIGMLFGSDGFVKIDFQDYELTEQICTVALIFIIFYGGFGTNWSVAGPVAPKALLLSSAGVIITAFLTCGFCYFCLNFSFLDSFLIGAVISSTDAASVFSILRSKNLSLKHQTASLLEIESGSNDPFAYMLTVIALSLMGAGKPVSIWHLLFSQIFYGVLFGGITAFFGILALRKFGRKLAELDTVFVLALVLFSYTLPTCIGGNGFLSVYILGILLGNSKISNKVTLVHFFDGITGLSQIVLFFLLGLLSFPHKIPSVLGITLLIALFLMLVARPVAVFLLMLPAKCPVYQCLLVSFAGLRGAASIVFAIIAMASGVPLESDIFHIVFLISLLSVTLQGTLLPAVARKLDMVDTTTDVRRTFTDYKDEDAITMMQFYIPHGHNWENEKDIHLREITITPDHIWCQKKIEELNLSEDMLIVLIKRDNENIIPDGKTVIQEKDIVILYDNIQ